MYIDIEKLCSAIGSVVVVVVAVVVVIVVAVVDVLL